MPDFNTLSGNRAWSNIRGQNTSQRVTSTTSNRPEAEFRLKNRKVEIRTGARVTRARGPWVGFKRMLSKLTNLTLNVSQQQQRNLRHAEYKFDRHVNRLVEDLANKPDLSPEDVSKRLNKLAEQAENIQKASLVASGGSVSQAALAERFEKNLNESLQALECDAAKRGDASRLNNVLRAFSAGGALHDISNEFTFHSDSDSKGLSAADRHEQSRPADIYGKPQAMTAADYVKGGIVEPDNPRRHAFGQQLIATLPSPGIVREAIAHSQNPKQAAVEFKQMLTQNLQAQYGSAVGDTLFNMRSSSAGGQGRDLNGGLTFADRQWLQNAAQGLASNITPASIDQNLKQKSDALPAALKKQFPSSLQDSNTMRPSGDLTGTLDAKDSGTRVYLDNRIDEAKPDLENPGLSSQFLKDVSRMDIDIVSDNQTQRLNADNCAVAMNGLTGGDQIVSLNLSKMMQQGLFNGVHGAMAFDTVNDKGQPVMVMIPNQQSDEAPDEKSLKVKASKQGKNYQLEYQWTPRLNGFMAGLDQTIPANNRASQITASTTITISEDDLRNGNLHNYGMTHIDYKVHFELDPVALSNQSQQ